MADPFPSRPSSAPSRSAADSPASNSDGQNDEISSVATPAPATKRRKKRRKKKDLAPPPFSRSSRAATTNAMALLLAASLGVALFNFLYVHRTMEDLHSHDKVHFEIFGAEVDLEVEQSPVERNAAGETTGGDAASVDRENEGDENDGKERIVDILRRAGVTVTPQIRETLPTWSSVTSLYGSEPVIYGLETCETFRSTVPPSNRQIGAGGTFNTGTNLLAELLGMNCVNEEFHAVRPRDTYARVGMQWQVPWGKHSPLQIRHTNVAPSGVGVKKSDVLAVYTIKDPYTWMGSMCRHPYVAQFRMPPGHCPDMAHRSDVTVTYRKTNVTHHESLAHFWNDYYGPYFDLKEEETEPFPRLFVRFEDLLFHAEEVIKRVCECAVAKVKPKGGQFKYMVETAKLGHASGVGLVSAIVKYGDPRQRFGTMKEFDREYARKVLRKDMTELFRYGDDGGGGGDK